MTKVYIFNIQKDTIKTDGRPSITKCGLHELICDRRIEASSITERNVISILDATEYKSVIEQGYYVVDD